MILIVHNTSGEYRIMLLKTPKLLQKPRFIVHTSSHLTRLYYNR